MLSDKQVHVRVSLVAACSILVALPSYGSDKGAVQNLIGLWTEANQGRHSVVLRRADGTYREKFVFYDPSRPLENLQSSGRWRVTDKYYLIKSESASKTTAFTRSDKWIKLKITRISKDAFRYDSSDNFAVEERRIGGASDQIFENTPIPPFPAVDFSASVNSKVRKATAVTH